MPNRLFRPLSLSELTATQQSSAAGFIPLVQAPLAPGGGSARPVNFTNEDGDTQLHLSSRSGDLQGVEELLTRRADPNAQNKDDDRPLHLAAEFGNAMVITALLNGKADINLTGCAGWTPLHWAGWAAEKESVDCLVAAGADLSAKDEYNKTPLMVARAYNKKNAVEWLYVYSGLPLHAACIAGDTQATRELLMSQADPNTSDDIGNTPLTVACKEGNVEVVEELLIMGALPDHRQGDWGRQDAVGNSPLIVASKAGHVNVVLALLRKNADTSIKGEAGMTALQMAGWQLREDVEKHILAHINTKQAVVKSCRTTTPSSPVVASPDSGFLVDSSGSGLKGGAKSPLLTLPLSIFRGRGEIWDIELDPGEKTVLFKEFSTVRSRFCAPPGAKAYFELEVLVKSEFSRFGFVTPLFERGGGHRTRLEESSPGVGGDKESWAVNGARGCKWHLREKEPIEFSWNEGDVIGLACDLQNKIMVVSVNGEYHDGSGNSQCARQGVAKGLVFEFSDEDVKGGLFAAFSGSAGKIRYNLGENAFKHSPPTADYLAFLDFSFR